MRRRSSIPRTAQNTVMDLLSRREHSEKELRQKLRKREFSDEEIQTALEKAKEGRWLGEPHEIAERFAEQLHRKNKGIHFINATLAEKGLPSVTRDEGLELEKARSLVKTKYVGLNDDVRDSKTHNEAAKIKAKVARFLTSRGFDSSTIRKVLKNEEEF